MLVWRYGGGGRVGQKLIKMRTARSGTYVPMYGIWGAAFQKSIKKTGKPNSLPMCGVWGGGLSKNRKPISQLV